MIEAKKYNLEVYDSISDYMHGGGYTIEEIYIPKYNITFNVTETMNVLETNRTENNICKDILLDNAFVLKLVEINNMQSVLSKLKNDIECEANKLFEKNVL